MASQFDKYIWQMSDSARLSAEEIRRLHAGLAAERAESVAGEEFVRELLRLEKLTPSQAASLLQAVNPGIELGDFLLLERLGQSRSAMVFRAEHRRLQRVVALKVLAPHRLGDSGGEQRIVDAVRSQARFVHPHLVATWGIARANGLHLLATEFVEGMDLQRLVQTQGSLSVRQAVEYCRQAAEALEYLHSRGVVHRDVQPSHLILDEMGQVRLLGAQLFSREGVDERYSDALGGLEDPDLSTASAASVAYLAPELALDDERADPRSDIYALGCTLYFLVSGQQPYEADSVVRQILAHRQHAAPQLAKACPFVTPQIEAIFQRMVAKRPEDRFATVGEFLLALSRLDPIVSDSVLDMDTSSDELPSYAPPVSRSLQSRETAEVRLLARDDGTIMEMSIQSEPTPARPPAIDSVGRPKPPQMELRLWFFLALILAAAALILGLTSWALTANHGRAKRVKAPNVVVSQALERGTA